MARQRLGDFDVGAFADALDAKRLAEGLSWSGLAQAIWALTAELNARRHDHPISPATLSGMRARENTSCQHALFMLRWLDLVPESFVPGAESGSMAAAFPGLGSDRRLRWDLARLAEAMDAQRHARAVTWRNLAAELGCTPDQLTGLRTAASQPAWSSPCASSAGWAAPRPTSSTPPAGSRSNREFLSARIVNRKS